MLGADVDSDIPDRMKDGYGLNRNLIDRALEADVDTIITCDNGIAAAEEIAYAKSMGMTIVVTDHHEVPYTEIGAGRRYILPEADAVVDPKQEDCTYPFKGLCGAAVAYKLVEALMEAMGKDAEDADYLMENVAIATIGDVMDLVDENRIFVKQGLDMLKSQLIISDLCWDHVSMPVEDWIQQSVPWSFWRQRKWRRRICWQVI